MPDRYEKINEAITRIERHQKALGLSDIAFCTRFQKYLGSAKSYKDRLLKRSFAEFGSQFERWERKLLAMVAELDGHAQPSDFLAAMPFATKLEACYQRLQAQKNDRRNAFVVAVTGCGKSAWAQWRAATSPREVSYVRADESWRENLAQIARGIAQALGAEVFTHTSAGACMAAAIEKLKLNPTTLIVDEGHEAGIMLFKVIKTFIDKTPSRFLLMMYPTSLKKVLGATDDAKAEAQQLFGRSIKPIFNDYEHGLLREDVVAYLKLAAGLNGESDTVAGVIHTMVRSNGNLRLLADAVEQALLEADVSGVPITGEAVVNQVQVLCPATTKGGK